MTTTPLLTAFLSAFTLLAVGQTPVDVADNTVKVPPSGESVFHYGFAEGDQLVFSMEELNGKELKEVEIAALPSSALFTDYKTKKVENKILTIAQTGVYRFRFANANLLGARVCRFKIQRIPAGEATKNFNTAVYKRTVYDSTFYEVPEKYLARHDTVATEILNQTAKVHSKANRNGHKTATNFALPKGTSAWSYYIGVDQAGQKAYENAVKQIVSNPAVMAKVAGASPLAALALGLTSYLTKLPKGEDIDYYLVEGANAGLFAKGQPFKHVRAGKVVNDFARMPPVAGDLSFCFSNDNAISGVTVTVKVVAVQTTPVWDTRPVKKWKRTPREEMYLKN